MIADLITISSEIQSGTPVFAKTRVPVKILFDHLRNGDTIEEFVNDYPSVKLEQAIQLLDFLEKQYEFNTHEESSAR